jgi:RsiW-degrading membrane proteinase PrsW (M82 family)
MLNQMTSFFISAFYFPGTNWELIFLAIAVGLWFGAIWLALYRPPLFKKHQLWVVAIVSAILTWTAIAFVQIPLQSWTGQAIFHIWSESTLTKWILLAAIPQILLSGIVQEAAKLAPVLFFWWRSKRNFTPQFGLIAGAVSGAGFGVFEAIWVHNQIFALGVTWSALGNSWLGLWERFFSVAFHITVSALAGYGLAKRKGWQFYLIAAFLHGLMNYSIILIEDNLLTAVQEEIATAIFAIALTAVVLWLRWRKTKEIPANNSPTPDTAAQMTAK